MKPYIYLLVVSNHLSSNVVVPIITAQQTVPSTCRHPTDLIFSPSPHLHSSSANSESFSSGQVRHSHQTLQPISYFTFLGIIFSMCASVAFLSPYKTKLICHPILCPEVYFALLAMKAFSLNPYG